MISRMQRTQRKERIALGEISHSNNLNHTQNTTETKDLKNKYTQNESNLNENQIDRLKQLKCKYQKPSNLPNLQNQSSSAKTKLIDTSFKSINLENFVKQDLKNQPNPFYLDQKHQTQSNKKRLQSSFLKEQFDKKIQQSNHRLESNMDRVQDKIKVLRQSYQKRNSFSNNQPSNTTPSAQRSKQPKQQQTKQNYPHKIEPQIIKHQESLHFSVKSSPKKQYLEQYSKESSSKRAYAQQLKSINFIDEIKRKIQEIQNQTKSNLQKKASQISKNSKINNKHEQVHASQNKSQKITLANFVPNLAESQVIQTSQRERFTQRNQAQKKQSIQSLVFQNYKFNNEAQCTKPTYSDKIMQDPQVEEMSIRASPILGKSPYGETNLEQTQMIQRNQLQGDLEIVEQEIQGEFVLLINRLAYQAEIDNRFASEIFKYDNVFTQGQSLKSIILTRLKQHYGQNRLNFDQKMFQVSQMQLDPLAVVDKVHKDISTDQIMKVGFSLKKLYDKNTYYFENKLFRCFSTKTIEFLIDELQKCHSLKANEELNVGHLTSYVNMRTGKNLRNRYFYRILKRIVKNNTKIGSTFKKEDLLQAFVKK